VSEYRKKIVVLLAIITVGSAALMLASPHLKGNESKLENSMANPLYANDPNFSIASNNNLGRSELFSRMILSVLLVVALCAAAIYFSKKLLPHTGLSGKEMKIIETVHLGPRKSVHLLKVGSRRLLIGSTAENITKLADVTDVLGQNEGIFADLSAQEVKINPGNKNDL